MCYEEWVRRSPWVRRLNSAYYHYRTHRWRWHPAFRRDSPEPAIDRPIFLLGTQGGGLTLMSRILRRIPCVVSATGDARYWAGYDEMQNVLHDHLPRELRLNPLQPPGRLAPARETWLYAADRSFADYHRGAADATPELGEVLRSAIRGLIRMNAPRDLDGPRFLDKSQSFSVRIGMVGALLRDTRPKFVLVTRDPFPLAWRAVRKFRPVRDPENAPQLQVGDEEKVALSAQHWRNTMATALEESAGLDLSWWRFEDFLAEPERVIREICDFTELPFSPDILPGPDDPIPPGSMWDAYDRSKWYPIRPAVNQDHLEGMPSWAIETVVRTCGPLLERFGYAAPRMAGTKPDPAGA